MISFDPLFKTLEEKRMTLTDLMYLAKIDTKIRAKFKKNGSMSLQTIDKICIALKVPIERVVEIKNETE